MEKEPLVSIVMPTHNREKTLPKAIDSVFKQTYHNWELIIVDDRSTDNTKKLVEEYIKKDSRIRYVPNTHRKGPGGARNQGLDIVKGEYIAFLDSDDEWLKHHLSESMKVLVYYDVGICLSLWYEHKSGELVKYREEWIQDAINSLKARTENNLCFFGKGFCEYAVTGPFYCTHINSLVFKKDLVKDSGRFNEKLPATQDIEFLFRLLLGRDFCLIKDYHFIYNKGDDNIIAFERLKDVDKISFHKKYYTETLKIFKRIVKRSSYFRNKKECIRRLNKYITALSFQNGSINWKSRKLRSINYYLKSLYYYILSVYQCPRDIAFLINIRHSYIISRFYKTNTKEEFEWLFNFHKNTKEKFKELFKYS